MTRCVPSLLTATTRLTQTCASQVKNVINNEGVAVIAAAGNGDAEDGSLIEGEEAGDISPGRVDEVITVGATDIHDEFAFFSNFGPEVNILAPGDLIYSAGVRTDRSAEFLSGTSQAT
jgi:subtilisin family serine protease